MPTCLFCDIAGGKIPAEIVYHDEEFLAFRDINPVAPTHILLIPRRHISSLNDLAPGDEATLGSLVQAGTRLAATEGIASGGYRLVINCGSDGGQSVGHLHLHILGGRKLAWPPG